MRISARLLAAICLLSTACLATGRSDEGGGLMSLRECRCPAPRDAGPKADAGLPAPRPGGIAIVRIASEPGVLLSMITPHPTARQIADHEVLETLVGWDPVSGLAVPELASGWEAGEDGRSFTFRLDPAARWHDGEPVTAADVEFTFARLLDPAGGAVSRADFLAVAEVEAVDDRTAVVRLDGPAPGFLASLSRVPVLPAHVFGTAALADHPAARAPIGSGPFRFGSWSRGREISLVRNETWRGEPPLVDGIAYRVVPDSRVAADLFYDGDLDVVADAPPGPLGPVAGGRAEVCPVPRFEAWVYDTSRSPFSEAETRRAMGHLIDREAIRCSILGCLADLVEGPWPPDLDVGGTAGALEFDPGMARDLLARAGWRDADGDGVLERDGERFEFTLLLPDTGRDLRRAVAVVQQDMARVGVEMRPSTVSWSTYTSRLRRHRFDASIVAIPNRPPFDPRPIFHSAAAASGRNFGRFSDPETDTLLDELATATTGDRRLEILGALDARLRTAHPMTFTFGPLERTLLSERVRGASFADGWIDERSIWLDRSRGGRP